MLKNNLILSFSIEFNHCWLNLTIFDQIQCIFHQIRIQNWIYSLNSYRCSMTSKSGGFIRIEKLIKRRFESHLKQNLAWGRLDYMSLAWTPTQTKLTTISWLNNLGIFPVLMNQAWWSVIGRLLNGIVKEFTKISSNLFL